jgi:hypothetical protein
MASSGMDAIVIDLGAVGSQQTSDEELLTQLRTLVSSIPDIPIGIYEAALPYPRKFTPYLLKSVSSLDNVWFYIDTSNFQDTKV